MSRLDDSPVQSGDILADKYRVERVLGVGGMGAVVAARHMELDEVRAIKVMLPRALRVAETVERFMREARSVVRLKSVHVVKVYDIGRLGTGEPYMVMEYLEGRSVKHLLEGPPPPPEEVVGYVLQALEAVAEAHAADLVHRDLKPSNLFLTEDADGRPCVKVLDFGISKLVSGTKAGEMTTTSDVLGSPFYMSPEQMRSTKDVDQRADLWSMGVILYQLLGGKVPFEGETITQVCLAVVQDEPAPLSDLRPDLPAGLAAIVMRCLKKDIEQRYQNAAELADDLVPFGPAEGRTSLARICRVLGVKPSAPKTTRQLAAAASPPASPARPAAPTAPIPVAGRPASRTEPLRSISSFADDEATAVRVSPAVHRAEADPRAPSEPPVPPDAAVAKRRPPSTIVMEDRAAPADEPAAEDDEDAQPTIVQPPEALEAMMREAIEARERAAGPASQPPAGAAVDSALEETNIDQNVPTRVRGPSSARPPHAATAQLPEQSAAAVAARLESEPPAALGAPHGADAAAAPPASAASAYGSAGGPTSAADVAAGTSEPPPPAAVPMPSEVVEAGATTAASWQQEGWPDPGKSAARPRKRLFGVAVVGGGLALLAIVVVALVAGGSGDGAVGSATRAAGGAEAVAPAAGDSSVVQSGARSSQAAEPPAGMVVVAGGEYWVGCASDADETCFDDEKPGRVVTVEPFAIMHHEVSVAEYARCVAAGQCPKPGKDAKCMWHKTGREAHPINCVTWEAAQAYCGFRKGRLPTEIEWEVAARGAHKPRYPWGDEQPSCQRTVIANDQGGGCGMGEPLATGSRPADVSWAKVFDMGGNVREWTATDYAAYPGGSVDEDSSGKVNRGGSWRMRPSELNTSHTRGVDPPTEARPDLGFRCAADL